MTVAVVSGRRLVRIAAYHRRRQAATDDPAVGAYHAERATVAEELLEQRSCCRSCGADLELDESVTRGYGPDCWVKLQP